MIGSKELLERMMEEAIGFKDKLTEAIVTDWKAVSEKTFEAVVNKYKTTIKVKFNKDGYPIGCECDSEIVMSEREKQKKTLNEELTQAVAEKNYRKAADIQDKIDKLK